MLYVIDILLILSKRWSFFLKLNIIHRKWNWPNSGLNRLDLSLNSLIYLANFETYRIYAKADFPYEKFPAPDKNVSWIPAQESQHWASGYDHISNHDQDLNREIRQREATVMSKSLAQEDCCLGRRVRMVTLGEFAHLLMCGYMLCGVCSFRISCKKY